MLEALPALDGLALASRARTTRAAVHGLATAIPAGRLTAAETAARLGIEEGWILSRTGIRERPIAEPHERLSDYAARAGAAALEQAGVDPADVDLVLVGTMSADEISPHAAPVVAREIGAVRAGAIDLGAACNAFLSGLSLAAAQVECGRAQWVLVIGADFVSRLIDWSDRKSAALFSDGAGAMLIGVAGAGEGGIGPILLGSDGCGAGAIVVTYEDRVIAMDGPEVYRHAVARMSEYALATLDAAGLTIDDVDLFVPHQANARITAAVGDRLGIERERVVDCIAEYGNSSAATIPMALAAARADGRLVPGTRVLLGAFGAGFAFGGGLLDWGSA